jgi:hypothetical protein
MEGAAVLSNERPARESEMNMAECVSLFFGALDCSNCGEASEGDGVSTSNLALFQREPESIAVVVVAVE